MSFANRLRSVISSALGLKTIPDVQDANSTQTRASHKTIHVYTHHTIRDYIGYSTPCISGQRLVKLAPQCRTAVRAFVLQHRSYGKGCGRAFALDLPRRGRIVNVLSYYILFAVVLPLKVRIFDFEQCLHQFDLKRFRGVLLRGGLIARLRHTRDPVQYARVEVASNIVYLKAENVTRRK